MRVILPKSMRFSFSQLEENSMRKEKNRGIR